MSLGVGFLVTIALGFLPGAWFGFTVPDRCVPWRVKSALSIAMAPAVLAVQIALFSVVGGGFSKAVYAAVIVNLFAIVVVALRRRQVGAPGDDTPAASAWLAVLSCFGLLIVVLLAMWLGLPNFRVYTWHNMMQLDACYQIVELPAVPQEWDLAGVRLNYSWLGLVQLTAVSWLLDCSPTLVFPWLNALQLLALVVFLCETARQFGARHPVVMGSTIAIILLGTNAVGMINALVQGPPLFRGEMRTAPFIAKYCGIDAMDIGLSLVAALVYVVALSARRQVERIWIFVPLLLLALGLSYPLLLPSALVFTGLWGVALTGALRLSFPQYSRTVPWLLVFATGGAVAVTAFYLRFLSDGRPMHAIQFALGHGLKTNLRAAFFGIGVMFALAYPAVLGGWRRRETSMLLLGIGGMLATALYAASSMPSRVQYKHLFTAELCLAPLVSVTLGSWFARAGRGAIACAVTSALIMGGLGWASLRFNTPPRELSFAFPVDESSFFVRARGGPDQAWLDAIRAETPRDAVLVLPDSPISVSTFTQRASLVPAQPQGVIRVGQGQDAEQALLGIKGYSPALYRERAELRKRCYGDRADFARLTMDLGALDHPVAIVFDDPNASFLEWLQSHKIGVPIGHDPTRMIRLLPRGDDSVTWSATQAHPVSSDHSAGVRGRPSRISGQDRF